MDLNNLMILVLALLVVILSCALVFQRWFTREIFNRYLELQHKERRYYTALSHLIRLSRNCGRCSQALKKAKHLKNG